jgi:hypothetical protein
MTESDVLSEPQPIVSGEPVLYRQTRALVGWLNDIEGMNILLGRGLTPNDDTSVLMAALQACRGAVEAFPPFVAEDPILTEYFPGLQDLQQRSEIQAAMGSLQWRLAVVDLTKVLSFQKVVHVDGLEQRIQGVDDPAQLLELCIPATQPQPPMGAFGDSDGKGFTISSYNPNLRIAGGQLTEAKVAQAPGLPEVRMQAVTLLVYMGTSYLQIVRYRDRCFIRDGYHRAAGLLRRGITRVPCIFIEARNFEEVAAPGGSFTFEVLFGTRPPRVVDFWNDAVARTAQQAATRKVVRIRGEEFVVPR